MCDSNSDTLLHVWVQKRKIIIIKENDLNGSTLTFEQ